MSDVSRHAFCCVAPAVGPIQRSTVTILALRQPDIDGLVGEHPDLPFHASTPSRAVAIYMLSRRRGDLCARRRSTRNHDAPHHKEVGD
jgi:hypothetical protein